MTCYEPNIRLIWRSMQSNTLFTSPSPNTQPPPPKKKNKNKNKTKQNKTTEVCQGCWSQVIILTLTRNKGLCNAPHRTSFAFIFSNSFTWERERERERERKTEREREREILHFIFVVSIFGLCPPNVNVVVLFFASNLSSVNVIFKHTHKQYFTALSRAMIDRL